MIIGSKGAELDLLIRQGATFLASSQMTTGGTPVNLTGATLRAQIRKTPSNTIAEGATAVCTITNAVEGRFTWEFTDEATAALVAGVDENDSLSQYVWDMEVEYADGRVYPVMYGVVKVFREVTKP